MEIGTIILSAKIVFYLLGAMSILLVIIAIKPIMIKLKNMVMGAKGYGLLKYLNRTGNWERHYVKFGTQMELDGKAFVFPEDFRGTKDEGIATIHYTFKDALPVDFYAETYEVETGVEGQSVIVKKPVILPEEMANHLAETRQIATEAALMNEGKDMNDLKMIFVGALALLVAIAYLCFQNYSVLTSMQHAAGLA